MTLAKHKTLCSLVLVFVVPFFIAFILSYLGYTGETINKGSWVSSPPPLSRLVKNPETNNRYLWQVIYICPEKCELDQFVPAGISTLGVKSTLVTPLKISNKTQLTEQGKKFFSSPQLFLMDPKQNIILQYPDTNVMDLISDLKKLLKPIEQRS